MGAAIRPQNNSWRPTPFCPVSCSVTERQPKVCKQCLVYETVTLVEPAEITSKTTAEEIVVGENRKSLYIKGVGKRGIHERLK